MKTLPIKDLANRPRLLLQCIQFYGHPYNVQYKETSLVCHTLRENENDCTLGLVANIIQLQREIDVCRQEPLTRLCEEICGQLSNIQLTLKKSDHIYSSHLAIENLRKSRIDSPLLLHTQVGKAKKVSRKVS